MKCSESTTVLCTCTATSKMHACNKCVQISSGADNTVMLSLAILYRYDLGIQLPVGY